MNALDYIQSQGQSIALAIMVGALIAARIVPVITLSPFMGGELVPNEMKVGVSVTLVILLFPLVGDEAPPRQVMAYMALLAKEVMIGVVIAYVSSTIFEAVRAGGTLIDTAGGANMASVMVPEIQQNATLFANMQFQFTIALFFMVGGHRLLFAALFQSFVSLPIMGYPPLSSGMVPLMEMIMRLGGNLFLVSLMIAAPVLAAVFLTDVALGLLNRVAPTVQVYFLAMPIKMMTAVALVLLSLAVFSDEVTRHFETMISAVRNSIELMR